MVLRDEKERKRLSRISRAVRSDTKCRIYKSELQPCNRDETCGVCLDCLDDFERYLTHDEQIEFKHCLVSAESRIFEKYQIEVAKIILERERDEILRIEALEEEKRAKKDMELQKMKQLEEEEKKMREAREREQQEKDKKALNDIVDAQIHEIKLKSTSFTNAELIEVVNFTPKGQKLLAERKQRLEEQLESAKFVNIPISNTLSPNFRVTINSYENIPDLSNMKHICVTIKLISREGIVLESTECVPKGIVLESTECVPGVEFGEIVDNCLILNASASFCVIPRRTFKCEKCGTFLKFLKVTYNSDLRDKKFRCTNCGFRGELSQEEYIWQSIKTWPPG